MVAEMVKLVKMAEFVKAVTGGSAINGAEKLEHPCPEIGTNGKIAKPDKR